MDTAGSKAGSLALVALGALVAWKTGTIYCFRDPSGAGRKPAGGGSTVVAQAQGDPAR